MKRMGVPLVLVSILVLVGCASDQGAGPPAKTSAAVAPPLAPGVVDGAAAHRLVAAGVRVVDVRTPAEFAAGHVPGAVNIPYDEMPQRFAEVGPPTTPVLVYCRSGRRSGIAIETLRARSFTTIYDLQAYDRWVAAESMPAAR